MSYLFALLAGVTQLCKPHQCGFSWGHGRGERLCGILFVFGGDFMSLGLGVSSNGDMLKFLSQ